LADPPPPLAPVSATATGHASAFWGSGGGAVTRATAAR
jgi:hypothetical protein